MAVDDCGNKNLFKIDSKEEVLEDMSLVMCYSTMIDCCPRASPFTLAKLGLVNGPAVKEIAIISAVSDAFPFFANPVHYNCDCSIKGVSRIDILISPRYQYDPVTWARASSPLSLTYFTLLLLWLLCRKVRGRVSSPSQGSTVSGHRH